VEDTSFSRTSSGLKFEELGLTTEVFQSIQEAGYSECTPIQESVIPHILNGKDVSGLAQTGTGKTAAFLIPLIDRYVRMKKGETGERAARGWGHNSYNLILVPTRELASQVEEAVKLLGKNAGVACTTIMGGASYEDQRRALREGVQFIVGTPGRLLDLYKSHELDLRGVNAIVFDEADRMFDMGFKDDMKFILRRVPRERQFLLFSATLNFEVLNTAYQFGAEPIEFNVSRDSVTAEGIEHEILHVGSHEKPMYLLSLLKKYDPKQCIIFSNYKQNVGRITNFLKKNGFEAMEMSSLLSQHQRNKVMEQFKAGEKQILVATDVAARGLDIKGVDLVINYELPEDAEGYVHRIGRTGRAGSSGRAIGLSSDMDVEALQRIETYLKEKVKIGWMEDSELTRDFQPFPPNEYSDRRPRMGGRPQRSSTGGGRGSGPRRDRPAERGPRPPRPAIPRADAVVQGSIAAPTQPASSGKESDLPSALTGQHRDRHLGRHHSRDRVAEVGRPPGAPAEAKEGNGHHRRDRHPRHGGRGGPTRGGSASQRQAHGKSQHAKPRNIPQHTHRRPLKKQQSGVVGKVKSFFGKLFSK